MPSLQVPDLLIPRNHIAQGALLYHDTHNLVQGIGGSHSSELGVRVVRGLRFHASQHLRSLRFETFQKAATHSNLDDVRRHNVQALQTSNDGSQLAGRPASRLGRSGGGGEGRIQCVDIERQVDGAIADSLEDLLNDAVRTDLIHLARLDDLEAAVAVVIVIAWPAKGCPDTGVDVAIVG